MTTSSTTSRADHCVIACAEAWRGDGEIVANPMGTIPTLGARLARATFEPDLVLTDGEARMVRGTWGIDDPVPEDQVEGWLPFRTIFDVIGTGRRHVMMGPVQIDQYGNANISCIGDFERPKVQLLGVRGAPGNTVGHATSYWVANHSRRSFVDAVDMVSGVGNDRAAAGGDAVGRYHDLRRVVSPLGVFDFAPDGRMRIASVHPGVAVGEVVDATGFELVVPDDVPETRDPTDEERRLLDEILDPGNRRGAEVS